MTTDVVLNRDKGYRDISFNENGDISTADTLDTAIMMALYGEQRANENEVPTANLRRGWIGNETTPGFEQGSKVWLFEQERITGSILAEISAVVNNAMQEFVTEGIAVSVQVNTAELKNGKIMVPIEFFRDGSKVDRLYFQAWENTGDFN